jgi:hypothetical protein
MRSASDLEEGLRAPLAEPVNDATVEQSLNDTASEG